MVSNDSSNNHWLYLICFDYKRMVWNEMMKRVQAESESNRQWTSKRIIYFLPLDILISDEKNSQNKTRQRQWHPIKLCGFPIRSPDSFNIDPIWYLYAHIGLYIIGIVFLLMCVCVIVLQRSVYIRCFFLSIAAWYRLHNYISLNIKNIDFLKKRETENWWIT